jgi:tetratricopeptide (TPR) repeat protein
VKTIIAALLLLLGITLAGGPQQAWAEEVSAETKAQAGQAFGRGMKRYQAKEYAEAIAEWEGGYRLIPQPVFLYNIAQAHRLSGEAEKALSMYRRYLRESPSAPNRAEVEERITALEQQLGPAYYSTIYVQPGSESMAEPPPAALLSDGKSADSKGRNKKLLPIVLGVVGGAVVVGVAVGLGVYFGTRGAQANVFEPVTP